MRLFRNRIDDKQGEHKRWGFWRWFDITLQGEVYLTRLTLLRTPWFSLKLHWIHKADPDRDLHDHPWWFTSFVLRGWYEELVCESPRSRAAGWVRCGYESPDKMQIKERLIRWFNHKNTMAAHRITRVSPKLLTLVVTGPKTKSWGFYDQETFRFTNWKDYHAAQS